MKIILPLFIIFFVVVSCSQVTIDKKIVKGKVRYCLLENGKPVSKEYIALHAVLNHHTDGRKQTFVPSTFIGAYSTTQDTLYQMLDGKGKILIDLLESDITFWGNQGFALKNNKWGIVNTKGAVVRNFDLDRADNFGAAEGFEKLMKHTTMYATSRKVIMQHDSYGMIDTKNNFIVPTKYHLLGSILYNKLEKKGFDQSLYTNWVFYNYENMCIVNAITGTVNTHRWDMEWYILPVPIVYGKKQYYIFSNFETAAFGLLDDKGAVLLPNTYDHIIEDSFADIPMESFYQLQMYCDLGLYISLLEINNKPCAPSFKYVNDKDVEVYPILNLPRYIFISQKGKKGVYDLETLTIVIEPIYGAIYRDKTRGFIGELKSGEEVVLKLN